MSTNSEFNSASKRRGLVTYCFVDGRRHSTPKSRDDKVDNIEARPTVGSATDYCTYNSGSLERIVCSINRRTGVSIQLFLHFRSCEPTLQSGGWALLYIILTCSRIKVFSQRWWRQSRHCEKKETKTAWYLSSLIRTATESLFRSPHHYFLLRLTLERQQVHYWLRSIPQQPQQQQQQRKDDGK
jgi:hypothetical protein